MHLPLHPWYFLIFNVLMVLITNRTSFEGKLFGLHSSCNLILDGPLPMLIVFLVVFLDEKVNTNWDFLINCWISFRGKISVMVILCNDLHICYQTQVHEWHWIVKLFLSNDLHFCPQTNAKIVNVHCWRLSFQKVISKDKHQTKCKNSVLI